ncbi:site-specific integrase [Marinobacter nanhaiticus D15-8W]|uniref:Site-specific integrase n=1 Tax=Marinobacter nanhaiticus D15-8W TaxID=626887 RepID=N6X741_9GAMM|nr:site-specific integrase [Marinobacter nanhaiticus]ENO16958.1 site-specific integrase [Marinobacter nanhaiticus D15-8W]BES72047.1 site-specific integrase [Marinobacter nanhaiticus D15-8W]
MAVKNCELPRSADSADKTIQKLKPSDSDQYFKDPIVSGLVLRIPPSGRKIWHLRYQADVGKLSKVGRKFTFGDFGEGMKTRQAREIAESWRVRIRQGDDPLEERRRIQEQRKEERKRAELELRSQKTLNDVAAVFARKLANPVSGHKDRGAAAMAVLNNHLLNLYGEMPIKQFRREHLFDAVDAVLARGHNTMANVVLTTSKTLFRFAVNREYLEFSPIDVVSKRDVGGPDQIRERVLCATQFKEDELHELFVMLPDSGLALSNQLAICLLLGTGCRVGELFKASWSHVDLEGRRWVIPSENSKNKDPIAVHLSDYTHRLFKQLHELSGHTDWLFPGRTEERGHIDPKSFSKQIGERQAGPMAKPRKGRTKHHSSLILPGGHWTVHDLRRTAATHMQMLGIAPHVIDECQNHRSGSTVRRRYQHGLYYHDMVIAWDLLGRSLLSLSQPSAVAKLMASLEHIPEPTESERLAMARQYSGSFGYAPSPRA